MLTSGLFKFLLVFSHKLCVHCVYEFIFYGLLIDSICIIFVIHNESLNHFILNAILCVSLINQFIDEPFRTYIVIIVYQNRTTPLKSVNGAVISLYRIRNV